MHQFAPVLENEIGDFALGFGQGGIKRLRLGYDLHGHSVESTGWHTTWTSSYKLVAPCSVSSRRLLRTAACGVQEAIG